MKYTVLIEDQMYTVEINDLRSRPIVALVDGEAIEIWPEKTRAQESKTLPAVERIPTPPPLHIEAPVSSLHPKVVRAPIPGVIIRIEVKPGDRVTIGQNLVVLEAMKMRNTVRAGRTGRIAAVHVTSGQTVNHNDPLIEYDVDSPGEA